MSQAASSGEVTQVELVVAQPLTLRASRGWWGIGLIVLTLLFLGGIYLGQDFLVDRPENAGLRVDPQYLDFGEVWAEKEFKWRIPIQNISNRPVGIGEFTATCQCSEIEPESLVIEPHSTAEVVATIDLTKGRDSEPYESERQFQIAISPIVTVATSRPPGFILRGTTKEVFTCTPRVVDLGEILSRTVGEPKTIRLTSAAPLSSVVAMRQPDMEVEIRQKGETEDQGHKRDDERREAGAVAEPRSQPSDNLTSRPSSNSAELLLTVAPTDQIPIGKIDRTVLLQATDADGNRLPDFPIKVIGEVVFDVAVEPREIYAGLIKMGNTYESILTLRSRTGSHFALLPVEQEPGVALVPCPAKNRLGEGCSADITAEHSPNETSAFDPFLAQDGLLEVAFHLRLTSQSRGDQRTMVRFQVINLTTTELADLVIPVAYYGSDVRPPAPVDLFNK